MKVVAFSFLAVLVACFSLSARTEVEPAKKITSTIRPISLAEATGEKPEVIDPKWKIVSIDSNFYLDSEVFNKNILIDSSRVDPEIKEVNNHKNLQIIVYYVGMVGDRNIHDVYHAVVFDTKEKVFLGNFPYKYVAKTGAYMVDQPVWKFAENKLTIKDKNLDFKKTLLF